MSLDLESPDIAPPRIEAPWTPEQVANLNRFQNRKGIRPLTCPYHSRRSLRALTTGWFCPVDGCDYVQDWAWESMVTAGGSAEVVGEVQPAGEETP